MLKLRAAAVGGMAWQTLEGAGRASVMGVTSRGVFLGAGDEEVVFISYETWRGPLTINLARSTEKLAPEKEEALSMRPLARLEHGEPAVLAADRIGFPQSGIEIRLDSQPPWRAELSQVDLSQPGVGERLRAVARGVVAAAEGRGWTPLLARWLDPGGAGELPAALLPIEESLLSLRYALRIGGVGSSGLLPLLAQIIGRGSGLTPSGDDVLVGLLLILSRDSAQSSLLLNLQSAIRNANPTTRLSARLMSAAAQGQADERLTTALDGILTANLSSDECAARLLAYGSSSGADTLLGMTLVI